MEQGKEQTKLIEQRVISEIKNMAVKVLSSYNSGEYFKKTIYREITARNERQYVKEILLSILRSNQYSLMEKAYAANICAILRVPNARDDIELIIRLTKENSIEKCLLSDALEAYRNSYLLKRALTGIFGWIPKVKTWFVQRKIMDIEKESNPKKQLEKKVMMEILGTLQGGMSASTAYMDFKEHFYDKLPSKDEKKQVHDVLISILASHKYRLQKKVLVAYVCADVGAANALDEIKKLMPLAKKIEDRHDLELSVAALESGKTMIEMIAQKARERGDL